VHQNKTIALGNPSYVWRAGQERRMAMIQRYTDLQDAVILDAGCGIGVYVAHFRAYSDNVHGVDIDPERVAEASQLLPNIRVASAEQLPYPDNMFDVVLSHEVLEHVGDDRAAVSEAVRVLKPGGRLVVFVPNRWYPFETHGVMWRGQYHFGNKFFINYLPNVWRNKLAPHVRVYTRYDLGKLFSGIPVEIVHRTIIFGAYDNIIHKWPALGKALRGLMQFLEKTPLRALGLSHFWVVEKKNTHS